jgi:hypothetical protein
VVATRRDGVRASAPGDRSGGTGGPSGGTHVIGGIIHRTHRHRCCNEWQGQSGTVEIRRERQSGGKEECRTERFIVRVAITIGRLVFLVRVLAFVRGTDI